MMPPLAQLRMILMVGIGGSGKTTLAKAEFPSFERISLDDIRMLPYWEQHRLMNLYMPDDLPTPTSKIRYIEHVLIDAALKKGKEVVIDDTNLTVEIRSHHIIHAKKYGYSVHAVFFQNTSRAYEQNKKRNGKKRLDNKILNIHRMELEPPRNEEGFDSVRTIVW